MTDLLSSPARPIIVLLLGALVIGFLDRLTRPRDRGILLVLLVADGALALLSLRARLPLHVILGRWRDLSALGVDWGLGMDGLAFLFAAAMLFVALTSSLAAVGGPPIPRAPLLVLVAAGLGLIFATDLITLSASGFLLDMAFAWAVISVDGTEGARRPAAWAVGLGGLTNLAFLTAALNIRLGGHFPSLDLALSSPQPLSLVTAALLIRLGTYPLYFWLPFQVKGPPVARAWLHLVPVATGLWLPTRAYALASGLWPWPGVCLTLGGMGFLIASILAWGETHPGRVLSWVILAQLGYGLVLITLGTSPVPIAINLLLGAGLLFVAPSFAAIWGRVSAGWARWRWTVQIPTAVGVGMLAGAPGTLGFVGRSVLYGALLTQGPTSLLAVTLLAESLLIAALLHAWFAVDADDQEEGITTDHTFARWCVPVAVITLTGAGLMVGLHPPLLSRLSTGVVTLPSLVTVLRGITLAQAAAIALPLVGGIALHYYRAEVWSRVASYRDVTTSALRLEWPARAVSTSWSTGREFLRAAGEISAGQGYLGWVVLIGLLVLLFVLK
jgi:NADH:ubiquinone oxidoreductase subunit 5 (subunit L)/multisubunit Na+/H+ antiporter MnhA subunit